MIVMKFGGTSVKDAAAMLNVFEIVKQRKAEKPIIVLSACAGITNQLHKLIEVAATQSFKDAQEIITNIEYRHFVIIDEAISSEEHKENAKFEIGKHCKSLLQLIEGVSLLGESTPKATDQCVTYGEILSTAVFEHILQSKGYNSEIIDSRKLILAKSEANFQTFKFIEKSKSDIVRKFKSLDFIVTQGYMAIDENGRTSTLGRGGSDYSASIIGAGVDASLIEIWTDVDGVYSCDPRILDNPKTISELSFSQIRNMAFFGAKVLHPDAIKPAIEKKIPVKILNTFNPNHKGTTITSKAAIDSKQTALAVVLKDEAKIINISQTNISSDFNQYASLLSIIKSQKADVYYSEILDDNILLAISNTLEDDFLIKSILSFDSNAEIEIKRKAIFSIIGLNEAGNLKLSKEIMSQLEYLPDFFHYNKIQKQALIFIAKDNIEESYKLIHNLLLEA